MSSIREELLIKAQRDKSKLVQVQRSVSRGGKTFIQNFWVLPSQVKATDKVIGGQQNLLPKPGSVATPAAGVLDKAYLNSIKSDKTKALTYLKSCGVKWDENSHEGINWMRAMQAANAALNGQNSSKISSQVNTQQQPQTAQTAQNNQAISKNIIKAAAMLKQPIQNKLALCKNGKEKVVVLKQELGQDGCMKFAKLSGITWDESSNPQINNMRMSMALKKYYDETDGTVSPTNLKGQGGGAPKGNQNAKKDSTPKNDPDKLKIPANATQRQINLINLINNVDSVDDLKVYTGVGMIAEDDVAKGFIFDKLSPKYVAWQNATGVGKKSSSTKSAKSTLSTVSNYAGPFGNLMSDILKVEGCKKDLVAYGFAAWYGKFRAIQLTDPRETISVSFLSGTGRNTPISQIIDTLNSSFSTYTTDDYSKYKTNRGYTGWNSEIYKQRYNHDNEGFIKALYKIVDDNPTPEIVSQVEKMTAQYDAMMEKVGYNPKLLEKVLESNSWDDDIYEGEINDSWNLFRTYGSPANAKRTLEHIEYQAKMIPLILERRGMSKQAIINTLNYTWNSSLERLTFFDDNGNKLPGHFDITNDINPDTGKPYFDEYHVKSYSPDSHSYMSDSSIFRYTASLYDGTLLDDTITEGINSLKAIASISQEDYVEIHKSALDIFGLKLTHSDLIGKKEDVSLSSYDTMKSVYHKGYDYNLEKADYNPQLDLILANLNMAINSVSANREIQSRVGSNVRSAINDYGGDYSKNFSFYFPVNSQYYSTRYKNSASGASYTLNELNTQINKQLSEVPSVSSEYINNLISYYSAKGNYDDKEVKRIASMAGLGSVSDNSGISINDFVDSPLKDILFTASTSILRNIPKMNGPQLDTTIAKKLDYVPYDFTASTQPTLSSLSNKPKPTSSVNKTELKQAREAALKAINCSVATEDEATSLQMRKDFMKDWDYKDGGSEKDPGGAVHTHRVYSGPHSYQGHDRRALFNSRFFKVNNSKMQDNFTDYHTELSSDTSLPSSSSEKLELYHACSYASTAGILGVTGGWFMGNQYTKVAKALGNGAYFGFKGGKSSVYCGEGSGGYHNLYSSGASGDNANGCYILATVMRGKPTESRSDGGMYRDWEIAVKNNKCIFPHHFVDISSRCLNVNVKRDAQGNYLDYHTGQITHDKYGKSVTMK